MTGCSRDGWREDPNYPQLLEVRLTSNQDFLAVRGNGGPAMRVERRVDGGTAGLEIHSVYTFTGDMDSMYCCKNKLSFAVNQFALRDKVETNVKN